MAPSLLLVFGMATNEFRKFVEDLFGDSMIRIEQFRDDQWAKVEEKLAEIAARSVHGELIAMAKRLDEVERRLAQLEQERAEKIQEEI